MACTSCSKPKTGNMTVKSTYIPKVNQSVKMTDILMNFQIEKTSNVSGQDKKDS